MKKKQNILIIILLLLILFFGVFVLYQRGIIFPRVILSSESLTLLVGDSAIITYETNNSSKETSWHSEDESVVKIDSHGYITTLKNGKTRIYLQYGNDKKYCNITVNNVLAESILLSQHNISLSVMDTVDLTYTISPDNTTDKTVTWESDNPNIVSVDNGKIIANSLGTAKITITTNNGVLDSCNVVVDNIKVR